MAERILKPAGLLVFAALFTAWALKFPSPKDIQAFYSSIFFGVIFCASYTALGMKILKALKIHLNASLKYPAAFAASYCLWGFIWALAGAAGLYNPFTAAAALAVSLLICIPEYREMAEDVKNFTGRPAAGAPLLYAVFAAAALFLLFAVSAVPAVYYDALVYHAAVPGRYIAEGRAVNIPENIFSYFPKLASMNWLFVMLVSGGEAYKLLQFYTGVMAALAVYGMAKREAGAGSPAFLIALTCPLFFLNATRPGAEVPMALLCAVLMALLFNRKEAAPYGLLLLCSFFAGSLAALKYTGAVPALFFAGFIIYYVFKSGIKKSAPVFLILAAVPVMPYLAQNLAWTGEAFYPFMSAAADASEYVRHVAGFGPQKNAAAFFAAPFAAVFDPVAFGGDAASPLLSVVFIFLPLFFFIKNARPYAAFFAFFYAAWFVSGSVLRFFMPAMPAVYLLAALLASRAGGLKHPAVIAAAVLQVSVSIYYAEKYIKPFSLIELGRQSYLESRLSYAKAAGYLNKLKDKGGVLVLGDARTHHINRQAYAFTVFNQAQQSETAEALSGAGAPQYLEERGIGYILLNTAELERLKDAGFGTIRAFAASAGFKKLVDSGFERIYSDAGCEIFRVKKEIK